MPRTLILITNHFPFGYAESFIETEYKYLEAKFDRILLLSRDVTSKEIRAGSYHFQRVNPVSDRSEKLKLILLLAVHVKKILSILYSEFICLWKSKKLNRNNIKVLVHDLSKAIITSNQIHKIIEANEITGEVVLYSYWLNSSALSFLFIRSNSCSFKRISRAHGGDIYEDRHAGNYLSFRNALAGNLDGIFCISQSGLEFLKTKIKNKNHNKLKLSRLGTLDPGVTKQHKSKKKIIVSCSFLVAVKRIDFLIDALALVMEEIEWIHIGNGPLENKIKMHAREKLSPKQNLSYQFKGALNSNELFEFYKKTSVRALVNTSSSEGIPVTMMEAQSFGIPILALNVGGVSEVVNTSNGKLLPSHATPKEYSEALMELLSLSDEELEVMREKAKLNWSMHYNAEKNFSTFADQISSLH